MLCVYLIISGGFVNKISLAYLILPIEKIHLIAGMFKSHFDILFHIILKWSDINYKKLRGCRTKK